MTKLYERQGRRFVKATNHTGWYLNEDYTLSETKTEKSIAVCILHTISEMIFCELKPSPKLLSWDDAKEYCSKRFLGRGRLPETHELLIAINQFKNIFPEFGFIWTNDEYSYYLATNLDLSNNIIYNDGKDHTYCLAFAFLTLEL